MRYIEGLVHSFADYHQWDGNDELTYIPKDAFSHEVLADKNIPLLLEHREGELETLSTVGSGLKLWLSDEGLHFSLKLDGGNWRHNFAKAMVRNGAGRASLGWNGPVRYETQNGRRVRIFTRVDKILDVSICRSAANAGCRTRLMFNTSAPAVCPNLPRAVAKPKPTKAAPTAAVKPRRKVWDGPRPQIDISEQKLMFDIINVGQMLAAKRAGRMHVPPRMYRMAGSSRSDFTPMLTPRVMARLQQAKQPPKRTPQKPTSRSWVSPEAVR